MGVKRGDGEKLKRTWERTQRRHEGDTEKTQETHKGHREDMGRM